MSSTAVAAIVLNYQHAEDTIRCLATLGRQSYLNMFPIVVDNGSDDIHVDHLRHGLDPAVTLIENGENLGYAAGNNVAIRAALDMGVDHVWVLNPDTTTEPDTLEWMVRAATAHPDAGIVGSRVFYGGSSPLKIWFDGATIDLDGDGSVEHRHMGALDAETPAAEAFRTGYVTGTSMLIRRETLTDVGLLPEDYFLYFEETHFNVDVQRAGWATVVEPRSRVHHFKRSTGALPTAAYMYYYVRNRLIFGSRFTSATTDRMIDDLDYFLTTWRGRVERGAPDWVASFDELVALALADGRAGTTGRRDLTPYGSPR